MSGEDRQHTNFTQGDKLAILDDVLAIVSDRKRVCMEKRWKYKKGDNEVIIRDKLEKVVVWVNKFKEIGDQATQYDPGHAAIPWAGVRFILQVSKPSWSESLVNADHSFPGGSQRQSDIWCHG